jgi:hypothetical protein
MKKGRLAFSLIVLTLSAASPAGADKKACAAAYVEAQQLKKDGSFKAAREQLIICSKSECLAAARKDCVAWLDEVNSSMPSLVIAAKGKDGKDTFDVRVTENDQVIAEKLSVNAIELDPGTHKLRFEHAGAPAIEREVVLRQGQKNQAIELSFAPEEPDKPAAAPAAVQGETDLADATTSSGKPPVLAYVLAGVGVVALAGTGYFWLTSKSEENDLEECEPFCAESDVDSVRQKRLYGDIALGVGVVSLGIATYLFLAPREKAPPPTAARFDLRVAPGAAYAGVAGHF